MFCFAFLLIFICYVHRCLVLAGEGEVLRNIFSIFINFYILLEDVIFWIEVGKFE